MIATDCISEGQNLQDCDFLINYDIHWNPVRIIQRFGRIDRIKSLNAQIQLVNFWPNMELDEYLDLESRVSGRMMLLDVSATGEENVIEFQAGNSVGVAVRAGTPRPDISSAEAFKKSLIAAKSVGYTDPALGGTSGIYLAGLMERLGIAADLKPKTKLIAGIPAVIEAIAKGDVEIGMLQISEIVPEPRLVLVGPLPPGLEKVTMIVVGMLTKSTQLEAGRALIKFLASPAALSVIKAKGMEPM